MNSIKEYFANEIRRRCLSVLAIEKNEMAYDLLEETGDKTYDMDTFKKAADLILNGKE